MSYKEGQTSQRYFENLRSFAENKIVPRLGKLLIKNLKRDDIVNLQQEMRKENLSSVQNSFCLMKMSMDYACKKGYISCNPCKYAQAYERNKNPKPTLNQDQIYKLIVTEKNHRYAPVYAVILFLALRFGEGLGLSWDQIDFEKRTV